MFHLAEFRVLRRLKARESLFISKRCFHMFVEPINKAKCWQLLNGLEQAKDEEMEAFVQHCTHSARSRGDGTELAFQTADQRSKVTLWNGRA
jgi:hypothetical protein